MADDFNGAKPVMTVRDNEFKGKIVDGKSGEVATRWVSVVQEGDSYSAAENDSGFPAMGMSRDGKARIFRTNVAGQLEVVASDVDGTDNVLDYKTSALVSPNNTVAHDYVVADGKKFGGDTVLVGARGAVKVRVGTFNGTTFSPKYTWFQDPKENFDHNIGKLTLTGDAVAAIRIEITNLDGQGSDVYSTLQGSVV